MKARFMIENPAGIEATLKMTMRLQDWEALREQLTTKWPGSDLLYAINDVIAQARKVFYASDREAE